MQFEWLEPDIKLRLEAGAPLIDTDACIRWSGQYLGNRPIIRISKSTRSAVRLVYQRHLGEVAKNIVIRNTCGNLWCVNPKHMKGELRSDVAKKAHVK